MKTLRAVMFLTLLFSASLRAQEEIKVMSYNVLEGLGNAESYGEGRHERCVNWLNEQKAEVIALQELYKSEAQLAADAKAWGHPYYAKAGPIGLTSKAPIEIIKTYKKGFWHGLLHCRTYGIDFFVVHLSPAEWRYRRREAERIKGIVDVIKQTTDRYVLLGDFNAHSPFDAELYKQHPELIEKYKKGAQHNSSPNLAGDYPDYSVMSAFYSFPLIDVTERYVPWYKRKTFPSPILIGVWRTAGNIGRTPERIDYILTSPEMSLKCKGVTIHNYEATDFISDHYPIEAVFEIEQANTSE